MSPGSGTHGSETRDSQCSQACATWLAVQVDKGREAIAFGLREVKVKFSSVVGMGAGVRGREGNPEQSRSSEPETLILQGNRTPGTGQPSSLQEGGFIQKAWDP